MTATQHPAAARFQLIGAAISLLKRKLRTDVPGGLLADEKAMVSKNELLKGWDPDKAQEGDTKARLEKLLAEKATVDEELVTALSVDTSGDDAAVKELKAAQAEHGKLSDADLDAAIVKVNAEIEVLNVKLRSLSVENHRRVAVKDMTEKLNVKTSRDRAILDLVLNPGGVPAKTKISSPQ